MARVASRQIAIRPLARGDIDAVVDIDAAAEGRSRRAYFERRFAAAQREPELHVQFAAAGADARAAGYIMARVLEGEFGRGDPALHLEAIGVRQDAKGAGVGKRLLAAIEEHARHRGIQELRTQSAWNNHSMLRWLDANGFSLAANHILDCAVGGGAYVPQRDDAVSVPEGEGPAHEIDYGRPAGNDFERLARDLADVRSMEPGDLHDIVRIDQGITGRDREGYMRRKLAEAMLDSAIRVSLTARLDGLIVGFLMARADLGDFGRTEPVAVLDTIGVRPEYAHRGVGHALLSQLFANLAGLRIERVETVVAPHDLSLLGFLYAVGFAPSQRIPFMRRIG
ncbi:MAG TPA: GNAT family N-acetyltransferase [Casimicrobiaceae bacterium]